MLQAWNRSERANANCSCIMHPNEGYFLDVGKNLIDPLRVYMVVSHGGRQEIRESRDCEAERSRSPKCGTVVAEKNTAVRHGEEDRVDLAFMASVDDSLATFRLCRCFDLGDNLGSDWTSLPISPGCAIGLNEPRSRAEDEFRGIALRVTTPGMVRQFAFDRLGLRELDAICLEPLIENTEALLAHRSCTEKRSRVCHRYTHGGRDAGVHFSLGATRRAMPGSSASSRRAHAGSANGGQPSGANLVASLRSIGWSMGR